MAQQDYFCVAAVQPEVHICESRKEILEKNLKRHLELLDFLVPYWSGMIAAPRNLSTTLRHLSSSFSEQRLLLLFCYQEG